MEAYVDAKVVMEPINLCTVVVVRSRAANPLRFIRRLNDSIDTFLI